MEPWVITLLIGLLGGGGIWGVINRFLDKKDGTKAFQKEVREELAKLNDQITTIKSDMDLKTAIDARVRILNFSDGIMRGIIHSKESFDQVLQDIDTYEDYCKEHPKFENNRTVLATKRIKEVYDKCLRGEKEFL